MDILALKMLYGKDFWRELKHQVGQAEERIFIAPAFLKGGPYKELLSCVPKDVPYYFLTRDDNPLKPNGILKVPRRRYHGKIFVIDNNLILGSHNLIPWSLANEGEFSILITTEYETVSVLLFETLFNIFVKNSDKNLRFIDQNISSLYVDECPFCGEMLADPLSIIECEPYGGYVSKVDCESYEDDGSCKYCVEPEIIDREILFCDDAGCGFGIDPKSLKLMLHAVNPPSKEYQEKVFRVIRLFNGLNRYLSPEQSFKLLWEMDLLGIANLYGGVSPRYLVDVNILKSSISQLVKELNEDLKKTSVRAQRFVDDVDKQLESLVQRQLDESKHKKEKQKQPRKMRK